MRCRGPGHLIRTGTRRHQRARDTPLLHHNAYTWCYHGWQVPSLTDTQNPSRAYTRNTAKAGKRIALQGMLTRPTPATPPPFLFEAGHGIHRGDTGAPASHTSTGPPAPANNTQEN